MVQIIEVTGYLLSAWLVLYVFVPVVGRLLAVYIAHDGRDALFRAAQNTSGLSETLPYLDVEFLCTTALYVVREGAYTASLSVASELSRVDRGKSAKLRRDAIYRDHHEILSRTVNNKPVRMHLSDASRKCEQAIAIRVLTGSPVAFVVGIVGAAVMLVSEMVRLVRPKQDSDASVDSLIVPSIHPSSIHGNSPTRSGLKVAYRMTERAWVTSAA